MGLGSTLSGAAQLNDSTRGRYYYGGRYYPYSYGGRYYHHRRWQNGAYYYY